MRRNDEAAVLAVVSAILLVLTGFTGARGVHNVFAFLVDWLGDRPLLLLVAYVGVGIASLGGIAVLFGGWFIFRDRVRTGRALIVLGTGAGFTTLILFLVANLRREAFSYLLHVLPAIAGVAFGIAARFRAKPKRIL